MMINLAVSRKSLVVSALFLFLLIVYSLQFTVCFAQPVSSAELINNAKQYDGQMVIFEGEAIGEVMARGNYAWVNLHDGSNAIGVWMPKDLTENIKRAGSYKQRGDWVEVVGIFHRACSEHGGDLDIHAQSSKQTLPGRAVNHRLNTNKRNLVFILSGVLIAVWILRLLQRK